MKDLTKVNLRWSESDSIDSKYRKNTKLDWKNLISSSDLDWNPHCELFVLILWRRLIILLDKILVTLSENALVRSELEPYLEVPLTLNVAQGWIEL